MDKDLKSSFLSALEQNEQKILRICSIYAIDIDDKKDLYQEVLANIWQSFPSFKYKSTVSTWMFRITLNVCLRLHSIHKKKQDRFTNMDRLEISEIKVEEKNNDQVSKLTQLRDCIKKLNATDRGIISLYLEDLHYKEISKISGLSENHIAVKIKRIKSKLLNCINLES